MDKAHWSDVLATAGAAADAVTYMSGFDTIEAAWAACEAPASMFDVAASLGVDYRSLVLAACDIARSTWNIVPVGEEHLPREVDAAEASTNGWVIIQEIDMLGVAARDRANEAFQAYYDGKGGGDSFVAFAIAHACDMNAHVVGAVKAAACVSMYVAGSALRRAAMQDVAHWCTCVVYSANAAVAYYGARHTQHISSNSSRANRVRQCDIIRARIPAIIVRECLDRK